MNIGKKLSFVKDPLQCSCRKHQLARNHVFTDEEWVMVPPENPDVKRSVALGADLGRVKKEAAAKAAPPKVGECACRGCKRPAHPGHKHCGKTCGSGRCGH